MASGEGNAKGKCPGGTWTIIMQGVGRHFLFFSPWPSPGDPILLPAGCSRPMFLWHSPPGTSLDSLPAWGHGCTQWGSLTQEHLLHASLRICILASFLQMLTHCQKGSLQPHAPLCVPECPCSHQRGAQRRCWVWVYVCPRSCPGAVALAAVLLMGPISRVFRSLVPPASALPERLLGPEPLEPQCGVHAGEDLGAQGGPSSCRCPGCRGLQPCVGRACLL